jgi:hypothetical protein
MNLVGSHNFLVSTQQLGSQVTTNFEEGFGKSGFIPLWFCRKWTSELEQLVSRGGTGEK